MSHYPEMTQAEAEAGTVTERRGTTPARQKEAIEALGAGGVVIIKRKLVDQTLASQTAMQDDNDLFFDLALNEEFDFRFTIIKSQEANDPDMKFELTGQNGLTADIEYTYQNTGVSIKTESALNVTSFEVPLITNIKTDLEIYGYIKALTAGRLMFRWAQGNSDVDLMTIHKFSRLVAHKL